MRMRFCACICIIICMCTFWSNCMYAFSQLLHANTAYMQLHVCNLWAVYEPQQLHACMHACSLQTFALYFIFTNSIFQFRNNTNTCSNKTGYCILVTLGPSTHYHFTLMNFSWTSPFRNYLMQFHTILHYGCLIKVTLYSFHNIIILSLINHNICRSSGLYWL